MQKYLVTIFGLVWLYILSGCSFDSNEKANELYVNASQHLQSMSEESESYTRAFESYKEAQIRIEQIMSKYSSSSIAVKLISGETKISGFTLSEYRKLEESLKPLAEAEQDPLSCALLFTRSFSSRKWILTYIAGKYAEAGQDEKAIELLSQPLEMAKTIDDRKRKADALADIASKYAVAGQNEKALELLSQALEIAKALDRDRKPSALSEIAVKFAETGQNEKAIELLSQALEEAMTIDDGMLKAIVFADIAGAYTEVGQNEKALELLPKALEMIKIDGSTIYLAYVAGLYAEAGQFGQALKIANTIEDKDGKARAFTGIAGAYAEVGQNEKALELLPKALELAKASEIDSLKDDALVSVAARYAEVGQFGQALEIAKAIEDETFQARAFIYIAGNYAGVWENLINKDMAMFSEIIHIKYPLKSVLEKK